MDSFQAGILFFLTPRPVSQILLTTVTLKMYVCILLDQDSGKEMQLSST